MSAFTARIQLLKASETDYETLKREIKKDPSVLRHKNLSVKADKIKKGGYHYRGNISLSEVVKAVYSAIRKTARDYSFTVVKNKSNG